MPDLFQIARDLIAIDSTTGSEEGVVAYLESVLAAMGLETRSVEVAPGRRNIQAGPERAAVLMSTHTDTVPPYLPLTEDDESISGRGACDTKGIIACMIEAGRRLLERGHRDFGFLFVVGEEVDNCGARKANETVRADWIIVGEPTENRIAVGHKGFLSAEIAIDGVACHSAYPELGASAIHRLLGGLDRVLATDFGRDDVLGPATVNIGEIRGGVAANVLAAAASAVLAIRVVTCVADVEERLRTCFADVPASALRITVRSSMEPPRLERLERLDGVEETGFEETVVAYGTDIPFMKDIGRPLLYGPGSIHDAHTAHERIAKSAMLRAVDDYVALVERLGG